MSEAPAVSFAPALSRWAPASAPSWRSALTELVNANAERLGTGRWPAPADDPHADPASPEPAAGSAATPVLATGHQAALWHPGILVKDLAVDAVARRLGAEARARREHETTRPPPARTRSRQRDVDHGDGSPPEASNGSAPGHVQGVDRFGPEPRRLHVVVDHDINDPWALDLPQVAPSQRLRVDSIVLAHSPTDVPTGWRPPVRFDRDLQVQPRLEHTSRHVQLPRDSPGRRPSGTDWHWPDALDRHPALRGVLDSPAFRNARSAAEQVVLILEAVRRQVIGRPTPVLLSSQLLTLPEAQVRLREMVEDARACAEAYNRAVAGELVSGLTPLRVESDRIELPLWRCASAGRLRVFLKTVGGGASLRDERDEPIAPSSPDLAPRALLLTGLLREVVCDLFVHGRGGERYDRVLESWWTAWRRPPRAPRVTATADLRLNLDVPVATEGQFHRALWWRHHLPHNMDHRLDLDGPDVERKRHLLAHMHDDRDRRRRYRDFREIHRINAALCERHPEPLKAAEHEVERARVGVANREQAKRRDWFIGLYPHESLAALYDRVVSESESESEPEAPGERNGLNAASGSAAGPSDGRSSGSAEASLDARTAPVR